MSTYVYQYSLNIVSIKKLIILQLESTDNKYIIKFTMQEQNQKILQLLDDFRQYCLFKYSDQDISNFFSSEYALQLQDRHLKVLCQLQWVNCYLFKSTNYKLMLIYAETGSYVFKDSYENIAKSALNTNTTEENLYLILKLLIIRYCYYHDITFYKDIENILVNITDFNIYFLTFNNPKYYRKPEILTELLLVYAKNIDRNTITFLQLNNFAVSEPERFY